MFRYQNQLINIEKEQAKKINKAIEEEENSENADKMKILKLKEQKANGSLFNNPFSASSFSKFNRPW